MKDYKWTHSDIRPKENKPLACISVRVDGGIKYTNFGDNDSGPYYYRPNKEVPEWLKHYHEGYFDNEGQPVSFSYWMYWDDFWEMLEQLPRIKEEEE